jgi:bifunctional pyridoxal-dependent enzyme with beta-cystathionase and maltose regulon repressor activities
MNQESAAGYIKKCQRRREALPQLMSLLLDHAHIALNDGTMFGRQGEGFARLNIGTPRCVLADALAKIRDAVISACLTTDVNAKAANR